MENEFERKEIFAVGDSPQLDVRNIQGNTRIESWDRSEIQVEATMRAKNGQSAKNTEIDIGQEGDRVWVKTKILSGSDWLSWFGVGKPAPVDYIIHVPRHCDVSNSMVSGETRIMGINGVVKQNTVSGPAYLEDVAGKVSLNGVSGDTEATGVRGKLNVNTVSGDVVVRQSEITSMWGNTVSGDIRLATALNQDGTYTASSVSGDVRLLVPAGTACTLKLATISGDIRTDLECAKIEDKRMLKKYQVNGGGVVVDVNTVSGDLRMGVQGAEADASVVAAEPSKAADSDVESVMPDVAEPISPLKPLSPVKPVSAADPVPAEAPAPAVEPVSAPERAADASVPEASVVEPASLDNASRLDILKAIDAGEISVAEGLAKLDELPFEK